MPGNSLKDPDITEQDCDGHVNPKDEEHHHGQGKVKNVPVSKESLKGMEEGDLELAAALLTEKARQLFPGPGSLPDSLQDPLQLPLCPAVPEIPSEGEKHGLEWAVRPGWASVTEEAIYDSLPQSEPIPYRLGSLLSAGFQRIESQKMPLDRFGNPDVHVPAEHPTRNHQHHAPKRDGDNAADVECGMEDHEVGAQGAEEDVNLEPPPELAESAQARHTPAEPGTRLRRA